MNNVLKTYKKIFIFKFFWRLKISEHFHIIKKIVEKKKVLSMGDIKNTLSAHWRHSITSYDAIRSLIKYNGKGSNKNNKFMYYQKTRTFSLLYNLSNRFIKTGKRPSKKIVLECVPFFINDKDLLDFKEKDGYSKCNQKLNSYCL